MVADDSREVPRVSFNKSLLILISPKAKASLRAMEPKPHRPFTVISVLPSHASFAELEKPNLIKLLKPTGFVFITPFFSNISSLVT